MTKRRDDNTEIKGLIKTLIWVIIGGIICGYLVTVVFTKVVPLMTTTNTNVFDLFSKNPFGNKEYVRVLVLGGDNTNKEGYGLCDTMALFTVNTRTKEVRAISFPRDTYIESLPGHKLNVALKEGGPEKVVQVIEENFLYPTMIDYYVLTSTNGLKDMVDLLGGVYIVVEKDMNYDDNWGNLHIHLKGSPEKQLLDGKDAEGYVRFRKDKFGDSSYTYKNGEKVNAGRIARQQKFMIALCNRVISLPSKTERAEFLKECYDKGYIVSNLKLTDWNGMADFFLGIKPEQMMTDVLPGEPKMINGVSYWVLNSEELPSAIAKYVLFEGENPNIPPEPVLDDKGEPVVISPTKTPAETQVRLLNGSGVKGLAAKIGADLKLKGYVDITTGNADSFSYTDTKIKCKEQAIGLAVKEALGVGEVSIDSSITPDVIVIIGTDLDK